MKTIKSKLKSIIIPTLLMLLLVQIPVFANTSINEDGNLTEAQQITKTGTNKIEKFEGTEETEKKLTTDSFSMDSQVETVTLEEVTNKLEKKGYEVVESFQVVVAPILTILLIVAFLTSAIGFVGKARNMIGYGIAAMLLIGLVYIGVMFAPEILDFFKNFITE